MALERWIIMDSIISEFLKQHNIKDENHPLYNLSSKYTKDFQDILKLVEDNLPPKYLKRIISKFSSCKNYEPYSYAQEAKETQMVCVTVK